VSRLHFPPAVADWLANSQQISFPKNWLLAIGCWLLAIGCWLLAIGYWLLAIGYWLLAIGYWILPIGYWLLSIVYWLLDIGYCLCLCTAVLAVPLPVPVHAVARAAVLALALPAPVLAVAWRVCTQLLLAVWQPAGRRNPVSPIDARTSGLKRPSKVIKNNHQGVVRMPKKPLSAVRGINRACITSRAPQPLGPGRPRISTWPRPGCPRALPRAR
jgi:hypothetical protein